MQTMKTPVRNRIFVRLSGTRRMPVRIVVYSDLIAAIVAVWPRSDLTAVGSSPRRVAAVMAQDRIPGQVRVPLPKTRHEDAEDGGKEADTPKAKCVPRLASVASLLRAAAIARPSRGLAPPKPWLLPFRRTACRADGQHLTEGVLVRRREVRFGTSEKSRPASRSAARCGRSAKHMLEL